MATLNSSSRDKQATATVRSAIRILEQEMREYGPDLSHGASVRNHLQLTLQSEERELFGCLYLTAQNQLIEWNPMFYGTLTQTSVYPREILRRALLVNAGGVILAHNHPSGNAKPSTADKFLTRTIKEMLELIDTRVLDHFIVGRDGIFSFAEEGLL